MKLLSLHLKYYKKLQLSGINEITIDFKSLIQLVVGSNGSGKSSLLYEASPLPASSNRYKKGGVKIVVLEHENSVYELTSLLNGKTGRHSFIKDGEEYNPGGTSTVQKQLVESEFNFTTDIHDLLTGKVKFTEMGPMKRREWIRKLSTSDLTFAFNAFNHFKASLRDTVGALKDANSRLAKESKELLSNTVDDTVSSRVTRLKNELSDLMKEYNNTLEPSSIHADSIRSHLHDLDIITKDVGNVRHPINQHSSIKDLETAKAFITSNEALIAKDKEQINFYLEEVSEVNKFIEKMVVDGDVDLKGLEVKLARLYDNLAMLGTVPNWFTVTEELAEFKNSLEIVIDPIQSLILNMDGTDFKQMSQSEVEVIEKRYNIILTDLNSKKNTKNFCVERIDHIRSLKDTICPECNYRWKEGVSNTELNSLVDKVNVLDKEIEELVLNMEKSSNELVHAQTCLRIGRVYNNLTSEFTRLRPLWNDIEIRGVLYTKPHMMLTIISQWLECANKAIDISAVKDEINETETIIAKIKSEGAYNSEHFTAKAKTLMLKVEELTKSVRDRNGELLGVYELVKVGEDLEDRAKQADEILTRLTNEYCDWVKSKRNEEINSKINELQGTLAVLIERSNRKDSLVQLVNHYKEIIDELEAKEAAFKLLIDVLSPTKGVIASQMIDFITNLVDQMNSVIGTLWEYDLIIKPCGFDSGELDYKFPYSLPTDSDNIPDVSEGSTAQKDLINFTFTLIVLSYLDFNNYPLYMDEIGASFDEAHRHKLVEFVKILIDNHQVSQIFMVNHYSSVITALTGCDICVLESTNITVPTNYNEHVLIA